MDFRVYVVIYAPVFEKQYEVLIPIDRRIHDVISLMKKAIPDFSTGYYSKKEPCVYNKTSGTIYQYNQLIKESNIRTGTRLILL